MGIGFPRLGNQSAPQDMTEQELLWKIRHAFQSVERPARMTVEDGDFECMDKDRTLHSLRKGRITLQKAFNPSYSIFSEILPEALKYFFEDFAKLALLPPEKDELWFGAHFMLFLNDRFRDNCDAEQREAVHAFLKFMQERFKTLVKEDIRYLNANTFNHWNLMLPER